MGNTLECWFCGRDLQEGRKKYCNRVCQKLATNDILFCRHAGCDVSWMEPKSWARRGDHVYCKKHSKIRRNGEQIWQVFVLYNPTHDWGKIGVTADLPETLSSFDGWQVWAVSSTRLSFLQAEQLETQLLALVAGERNVARFLTAGEDRHKTFYMSSQQTLWNGFRTLEAKASTALKAAR